MGSTCRLVTGIVACTLLAACVGPMSRDETGQSGGRGSESNRTYADTVTAAQLASITDDMAHSLLADPLIDKARTPPILALRELENRTDLDIDPMMFLQITKSKIYDAARGKLFFRDDYLTKDLALEQLKHASMPVAVKAEGGLTGSIDRFLRGESRHDRSDITVRQEGTVTSRMLDVDFFLRATIYQIVEREPSNPAWGVSTLYYHYQMIDSQTGVVVWEKMHPVSAQGYLTPRPKPAPDQTGDASAKGFASKFKM